MKILKYILIAGILLTLYITEPMWRVQRSTNTSQISQTDKEITEKKTLITSEAKKLTKLEKKIGKKPSIKYKSRVPKPLEAYWNKTFENPNSVTKEKCSQLKASDNGWATTCYYKVNNILRVDNYVIKNGIVANKNERRK